MRAKRAKQYKKLMQQFSHLGFREPYQVLVDADLVKDVSRFKMDLQAALDRTLRGKSKPMITQCSIRHLYAQGSQPGMSEVIDLAKTLERRRCGHHPEQYPTPLSTLECLTAVVDPSSKGTNKHNYVVASQSQEVRQTMRAVRGVPLIYVTRSVMLMEPISAATAEARNKDEMSKFREGIRRVGGSGSQKRKREDAESDGHDEEDDDGDGMPDAQGESSEGLATEKPPAVKVPENQRKKKRKHGPKGPNPLSMKKKKAKKPERVDAAGGKAASNSMGHGPSRASIAVT